MFAPISREGALVLNNILLCSICAVVMTGTIYPLFADLLFGAEDQRRARRSSTRPCCRWPCRCSPRWRSGRCCRGSAPRCGRRCCRLWWAALVAAGRRRRRVDRHAARAAGARRSAAAAWLILGAFAELVERMPAVPRAARAAALRRLAALPLPVLGAAIAHAGMGVTVAGIAGMSLAQQHDRRWCKPGETFQLAGYDWTLIGAARRRRAELHRPRRRPSRSRSDGAPIAHHAPVAPHLPAAAA